MDRTSHLRGSTAGQVQDTPAVRSPHVLLQVVGVLP